ncbi:AraC family transcriptional regulator [Neobacillus notoginsengisoli]|uniref:AraC family transcriptional regulator n=1 Tax=Neobacillus notoginsengisoli TaxID=1578198 RepID=A0A417YTG6_9BACI|nr:AraC family transcriptional regulator [Neobacillus notoginsengisoli]RHW40365.1 AraC family transcriptional regulator [Neobacillus notoginsengisoli]
MTQKNTLHILNGQVMYDHFKKTQFLEEEWMIPFNEAMCYGDTCDDLFSPQFTETRAKVHHVTTEQYTDITLKPLKPLFCKNYTHLFLWFDGDMFCQINILTILAWLDQTGYMGSIELHIVGDKYERKESFSLKAEGYDPIYKQVLIQKKSPESIFPDVLKNGIELYLAYLKDDSDLIRTIKKHQHMPEAELVTKLIVEFQHLGLGDTQYLEMIRKYRET